MSTLRNEFGKGQSKLINYLIFGHLSKSFDKPDLPAKAQIIPNTQTSEEHDKSESTTQPTQHIKNKEENKNLKKEYSLENLLVELSQESNEVTFSEVIVQLIKLSSKFEQTSIILNIIITIVSHIQP